MRLKLRKILSSHIFWLILILIAGCIVRLAGLSERPLGLHQDEAFSAYNAWAVMHYGTDSAGYVRPVYYTVWGSGMNVLYSYLQMPFLALFGDSVWVLRLPQALLGCISIPVAYLLGKRFFDAHFGLAFASLLAITPWHILQSRFGLESYTAVPMLLFGVFFLCRYLDGNKYSIYPAALFLGLTLYGYAISWPLIPLFLVLTLLFFRKRITVDKHLFFGMGLLFLLALPLLLFLAVNFGWIPEIRTTLFSIPKLTESRTGEFNLGGLKRHLLWLLSMLAVSHDDQWWITGQNTGVLYYVSIPFVIIGILAHFGILWKYLRKKEALPLHFIMFLWFASMFAVACCVDNAKYYKISCMMIPLIFYTCYGLFTTVRFLATHRLPPNAKTVLSISLTALYCICFLWFLYKENTYSISYEAYGQLSISHMFWNEYEEALDYAQEITDGEIAVCGLNYANVLWYSKLPPEELLRTVTYDETDLAFRQLTSFDRYHFEVYPSEETKDWVYVFPHYSIDLFENAGYRVEKVTNCYCVAYLDAQ